MQQCRRKFNGFEGQVADQTFSADHRQEAQGYAPTKQAHSPQDLLQHQTAKGGAVTVTASIGVQAQLTPM
jgi:hypothetical protein